MRSLFRVRSVAAALLLGLGLSTPFAAQAQAPGKAGNRQELRQCLDAIRSAEGVPGALLSTTRQNLRSGVADLETERPLRTQDRFRIGSNTKTFVATIVLQLVAEGKLSLDDRLGALLGAEVDDLPFADEITVRQLLNMTSGVYDYNDAAFQEQWYSNPGKIWTPQEIIDSITGKAAYFEPGSTCAECPGNCYPGPNSQCWHYSNTNYILLGRIIETVTGRSLERELRSRIFEPLELRATSFPVSTTVRGQHSQGYMATEIGGQPVDADCPRVQSDFGELYDATNCLSPTAAWAAGAIVSSVADLRTWLAALVEGTLLPRGLQRERLTFIPGAIGGPGGIPIQYGLGIMRFEDSFLGLPGTSQSFLGHGGEFQGYASVMMQGESCNYQILDMVNLFPQPDPNGAAYFSLFVAADAILCHNLTCDQVLSALASADRAPVRGSFWKAFP